VKHKPTRLEKNIVRLAILDFADEHKLLIDPSRGMEHQVDNYFRFGHCPCDPTASRTRCPCMYALIDVKETGHCLCRLYWKDLETFRKLYEVKDEESD